jgi:hypothetical protein
VKLQTTPAAAAVRTRTLSALGSPFALPTADAFWRQQLPALGVPAVMRGAVSGSLHPTHNSIPAVLRSAAVPTVDVTPDHRRDVYGAAKQAAPPRGVPR